MSIQLKKKDYWKQFSSYQTFSTVQDLNTAVRKSTNELPFVSAHMLHDLYLRWTAKHNK